MNDAKQAYRQLCEETYIPLSSQAWWLDEVCGTSNWQVCIFRGKDGKIKAAMPYYKKRQQFFDMITMPAFTTYTHIYMAFPKHQSIKRVSSYTLEKKFLEQLITQLPSVSFYKQNFTAKLQNWLPFYWNAYKQTTRYTYIYDNITDLESIYNGFKNTVRTDIKKAQKHVSVETDDSVHTLYKLITHSFQRKGKSNPFAFDTLHNLHKELQNRAQSRIFIAKDIQSNLPFAALMLIWDAQKATVLLTGLHQNATSSAALQLIYWEAIQFAAQLKVQTFDFEGSMDIGIEHIFRAFGAKRIPYFQIYKAKNKFLETIALWLNKF